MPAPKNPPSRPCPLLRRFAVSLCLATAALTARADIIILREKGPHSGSAFSNPGIVADAPSGLIIAMKNAEVKIHLRPGDGDTLKADCVAEFELEDSSTTEAIGKPYLVGFPVTGLNSKIVTIDNFAVKVDGKEPACVFRQGITIPGPRDSFKDTPISGVLSDQLEPEKQRLQGILPYRNSLFFQASFVWQQVFQLGSAITHVQVTYTVTLKPQSVHYSKAESYEDGDEDIIPSSSLRINRWMDRYYFFDYILRSGATWDGPIGRESIVISSDPSLGLEASQVTSSGAPSTDAMHFELRDAEPVGDLLIAIPVSAIHRAD